MSSRKKVPFGVVNFLSIFEGIEGGFAIFAGIVLGLSFENIPRHVLIASAVIAIVVNALNSATIRFSSEHYEDELDGKETRHRFKRYFWPALIEFLSYAVVSLISVVPLVAIDDLSLALAWMSISTMVILFFAGWYRGHLLMKEKSFRDGFEVLLGGLIIMAAGTLAGWFLKTAF